MEHLAHITTEELIGVILGIALVWILKYSKEKDIADEKDESFSLYLWLKEWLLKRNDNILAHVFFSFSALYIGVDNLQAWLGENMSFPEGLDEVGAAYLIGFTGSFIVEILKKAL